METVAIVGVGLIGGSFGLALKKAGFRGAILGVSSEAAVRAGAPAKSTANWISTEVLRWLKHLGKEISQSPVSPATLAELLAKVEHGEITTASGKKVLATMFETGKSAAEIIAADGVAQISDASSIEPIVRAVIAKNAENVAKYRSGNEAVFKFFVGQVMRETHGQANPQLVNEVVKRLLSAAE